MARAVVLFVAAMAAAVLAGACGAAPQRVEVGEIKTQSRSVEVEGADSAKVNLRLALGELDVGGGAAENRLMEADFAYNVAAWEPSVDYGVVGDSGELEVRQRGLTEGIPTQDVRNEWDVRLGEDVPVDLTVQMGGGVGNLDLDGLDLTGLNLDVGAGSTRVDLSGDWGRDLSAVVRGGAGEVTMLLPGKMGVRVTPGPASAGSTPRASRGTARPTSTTPTATRATPWRSTSPAASGRSACNSSSKKTPGAAPRSKAPPNGRAPNSRAAPRRCKRAPRRRLGAVVRR